MRCSDAQSGRTRFLLLLLSLTLITLLSCCSWLYPLQPADDAHWFMSIGKGMLHGKLLYTDMHDQKGPLLFFLHEWAAALSSRTYLGIYLAEVACCYGFLLLSYRTMRMFAAHGISLATTGIVGLLTYSSDFMWYGDNVEEFALPILLFALYLSLRFARHSVLPSSVQALLLGAGIAVIFWMKFTVLAMLTGAVASMILLAWKRGQMQHLLRCIAWGMAGVVAVTLPVLLYFVVHGNAHDLFYSYFYFNIFLYTDAGKADASASWWPAKWAGWLLLVGAVLLPRANKSVKQTVAACWGAELLIFVLFKVYIYYFLTVYAFAPLAIYFVRHIRSRIALATGMAAVTVFAVGTNYNLMTLLTGRFPQAVMPLAETVNADPDPEKQVLTLNSYDTGIYTLTDCLPPIKYFSIPNAYSEEVIAEQTAYLASRKAKYVIQKDDGMFTYYRDFHPDVTRDYTLCREEHEGIRRELLLHPLQFLWSLGYMNGLLRHIYTPTEGEQTAVYRLYRRKQASAHPTSAGPRASSL